MFSHFKGLLDFPKAKSNETDSDALGGISAVEKSPRVLTPEVIAAAGIRNGMQPEEIDRRVEAVYIARGQ